MATTKTLISNIRSLACNGIISDAEAGKLIRKVKKQEEAAFEEAVVAEVATALTAFVQPGIEYKISDLVKEVMGISAPCHGHKETKDEQKYRDGVAKPRMKAAIASLGDFVSIKGSAAQTRYLFNGELPEVMIKPNQSLAVFEDNEGNYGDVQIIQNQDLWQTIAESDANVRIDMTSPASISDVISMVFLLSFIFFIFRLGRHLRHIFRRWNS